MHNPNLPDPCDDEDQRRQELYYSRLVKLDEPSRKAFSDIYVLAHQRRGGGEHMIKAAIESMNHPAIFQLAKENIMLRFARAIAVQQDDKKLVERIEHLLDAFHVASDAYVLQLSLENARAHRRALKSAKNPPDCRKLAHTMPSQDETEQLLDFARHLKLNVAKIRQIFNRPRLGHSG